MDKKSHYLLWAVVILVLVSIFLTYKRSFIDRNFDIISGEEEVTL